MEEIITELSGNVLRVQLNRPSKKNAMTLAMYAAFAEELDRADKNDDVRVVLVHGAGDSFTAGNDIADFTTHPPGPGDIPQALSLPEDQEFPLAYDRQPFPRLPPSAG
jgi:enoyl-CoA hydratase/carnithine racemase